MRIPMSKIRLKPMFTVNPLYLEELKQDILETDLHVPIVVEKRGRTYLVHDGVYRFLACKELGYTTIPVKILEP